FRFFFLFFFSSRRRHTRFSRDWSSDVCSSDLPEVEQLSGVSAATAKRVLCDHALDVLGAHLRADRLPEVPAVMRKMLSIEEEAQIGRASCRERVEVSGVAGAVQKNNPARAKAA